MYTDYSLTPKKSILGEAQTRKKILKILLWATFKINFFGVREYSKCIYFSRGKLWWGQKLFFNVLTPEIQFLMFSRVNSDRIFKHIILELSYEMDSKNIRHTFEKFFSQIQLRDTVV